MIGLANRWGQMYTQAVPEVRYIEACRSSATKYVRHYGHALRLHELRMPFGGSA